MPTGDSNTNQVEMDFVECASCAKDQGSVLCASCAHNKMLILSLKGDIKRANRRLDKVEPHWCMCTRLQSVARDGFSTCSICGGKDAYGTDEHRPENKSKTLVYPIYGKTETKEICKNCKFLTQAKNMQLVCVRFPRSECVEFDWFCGEYKAADVITTTATRNPIRGDFILCPACEAKPVGADLCTPCLFNRDLINCLKRQLNEARRI